MFFNKKEALNEEVVMVAGATAGIYFRLQEIIHGLTPVNEAHKLISNCIDQACKELSIKPDTESRSVIHMIAISLAMDETGLGEKITNRYMKHDKTLSENDTQQIWNLTLENSEKFKKSLN